jgi:hypothetical protein
VTKALYSRGCGRTLTRTDRDVAACMPVALMLGPDTAASVALGTNEGKKAANELKLSWRGASSPAQEHRGQVRHSRCAKHAVTYQYAQRRLPRLGLAPCGLLSGHLVVSFTPPHLPTSRSSTAPLNQLNSPTFAVRKIMRTIRNLKVSTIRNLKVPTTPGPTLALPLYLDPLSLDRLALTDEQVHTPLGAVRS